MSLKNLYRFTSLNRNRIPVLTVPEAPTINSIVSGDQELTVHFTLAGDGGSPITDVEYRLDGGPPVSFGATSSPQEITSLTNDQEYDIQIRTVNAVGNSSWSNTVSAMPEGGSEVTTFAVPSPTIMSTSPTGSSITIDWQAEDLSNKIDIQGIHYGIWDHVHADDQGEIFIGTVDHGKPLGNNEISTILNQGLNTTVRLSLKGQWPDGDWEDELDNAANVLSNINPNRIVRILLMDEPVISEHDPISLESLITEAKNRIGSHYQYGFTYKQNNTNGWGGPMTLPASINLAQINFYPFRDDGVNIPESRFKSTSSGRGLPACLERMTNQLIDASIAPSTCTLGVTGQAFGPFGTTWDQFEDPNPVCPIWYGEVIRDFNAGVYTNNGFQVSILQWYEWRTGGNRGTGISGQPPELLANIKKLDTFGRSAATINNVRLTARNVSNGQLTQTTVSNSGSDTITGLSAGTTYDVWVESIVGGEFSAKSNIVRVDV